MDISVALSRLWDYQARHGLTATLQRVRLAARRALFSNRSVLFYCDLATQTGTPPNLPIFLNVEPKTSAAELSSDDLQTMTTVWNPKLVHRNIRERFNLGASLWLIKSGGRLAGYGWTLRGTTVEPHYFRVAKNDAHLFDFQVFAEYRGQGMNPLLVNYILQSLAKSGVVRAFIEAAEWNHAQLSSLTKTPFRRLGSASKLTIFGRTIVCWAENVQREPE
jgi:GNAT superfamily N-acetyltransferase